jgi:predicted helicase
LSKQLINTYRAELDRLRTISGHRRESVLREAFKDLLKSWGRAQDLLFVAEHDLLTKQMTRIYVDGALMHGLRVPFGYWEAKDEKDDLDKEIADKFRKGYPKDNIVFTDDRTAVLWQDGAEVTRAEMQADNNGLLNLLTSFFAHERQEIADFNKAVKKFAGDLPQILEALRSRIAEKQAVSSGFAAAFVAFLQHARNAINPAISEDDVREMLIQHVLTEDIFAKVFNDPEFHRKNNVAAALYKLEEKLFARGDKAALLRALNPYYAGIASTAALIQSHSEKQGFLKALYEDFYKAYNRKAADRLGVVYTPAEIVRFMIRSADWLCEKHFGKNLIDRGVEILDPATGTGTFIVELLEHFRGNREKFRYKYNEELHANEVAILPYYVANLNIEATYQAITGQFAEYENLCLVDTLDNTDPLGIHAGHQFDLLGALSDENIERIKRQNRRKISVIIGNPPYNANQQNENDNNKNRTYTHIDKRIKDTYVKASTAQKTKLYDMYARFYRWATDRLGDEGVLAFVTNRSFIDRRTFDGFRKLIAIDFQDLWLIDLGGDVRANPKLSGTKHNVFGIQTGVAIALLVRRRRKSVTIIKYARRPEAETAEDKLSWLADANLAGTQFDEVKPSINGDWISQGNTEFVGLTPLVTSNSGSSDRARSIFYINSVGINTARDDWVYNEDRAALEANVKYTLNRYAAAVRAQEFVVDVKWSETLKRKARGRHTELYSSDRVVRALYRPYSPQWLYLSELLIDRLSRTEESFPLDHGPSPVLAISGGSATKPFQSLASSLPISFDLLEKTSTFPRYRYTKSGERWDNITDWALNKFVARYGKKGITKDSIFHYVYAVLHDPNYRETYELNLKREFPRIPFYTNFARWSEWGKELMRLHMGYEEIKPWPVKQIDKLTRRASGTNPRPILRSVAEKGIVYIDEDTQIAGIPRAAWDYRLGNRSAVDWVLDQHKEKIPRDSTIREKFNSYRFVDYKKPMIARLAKVARVSVDTVTITEAMKTVDRNNKCS